MDEDTARLRRVTIALGAAVTSDEVAAAILEHAVLELGATTVSLWLRNADAGTLDYTGGAGQVIGDFTRFVSLPLDADLPGTIAVRTRAPITYRSTDERNERWPSLASVESATEATAILPLEARGEVSGCLSIGFGERRDIDNTELSFLLTVADQCALALDRAMLLDAERRARQTLEFLAEATQLMVTALDPIDVIHQLLDHAVPQVADWCGVFVHEGNALKRMALAIADEPDLAARIVRDAPPVPLDADVPVTRVWRTGISERVARMPRGELDATYGEFAGEIERLGVREFGVVPIVARGNRIGVITFAYTASPRRYTADVEAAAAGLAGRCGIALDIASRFERERTTAATLVAAMLPERLPKVPGWSIVARYLPAGDAVCGDWYDVAALPRGELLVGVGDAAGHGLPAAAMMAELRNAARGLAIAGHEPGRLLDDLSALAAQSVHDSFATSVYGRLDPESGAGRFALAGHPPPLLVTPDGRTTYVERARRPPLGIAGSAPTPEFEVALAPGATLVLFSDGLVERRGELLDAGFARLASVAAAQARGTVDAVSFADAVIRTLCQDLADDCCLLVVHRDEAGAGAGDGGRREAPEPLA